MNAVKPVIAVIGSGAQKYSQISKPLGKWIAARGCHLLNGGGQGVMAETAKAFAEVKNKSGMAIGILPSAQTCGSVASRASWSPPPGYPNPHIELAIYSHLHLSGNDGKNMASRNHMIVLSASIIVALPGGAGTLTEMELALEYKKPLLIISPEKDWQEFAVSGAVIAKTVDEGIQWLSQKLPHLK